MDERWRTYRGAELAGLIAGADATPTARWVEHPYGTTAVPGRPQRIVTLGPDEHELLLHLGMVPLLVKDSWGDQPHGVWPWARHLLGGSRPATFAEELPSFDALRALQPDLILATWARLDEALYHQLTAIAPTLPNANPADPWRQPWDEHFMDLAVALGRRRPAEALVDSVHVRLMAIAEAHPQWRDMVAASVTIPDDVLTVDLDHQRSALLGALGFRLPDDLRSRAGCVPFGELGLLDRDLLLWVNGTDDPSLIVDLPERTTLAAHHDGREVYLDKIHTAAFSVQSPLSLHFLLDVLVPEIEAAVDGQPSPPVSMSSRYGVAPAG